MKPINVKQLYDGLEVRNHYDGTKYTVESSLRESISAAQARDDLQDYQKKWLEKSINTVKEIDKTRAALKAAIDEAEGASYARTIIAENIIDELRAITEGIAISWKNLIGTEVHCDFHATTFRGYMHGKPYSTQFTAVCKSTGWVVTSIYRGCTHCETERRSIKLSDSAKQAVIANIEKGIF